MQSQQVLRQGRIRDLSPSSELQPDRLPRRRPVGMQAGLAATVLAALFLCVMLCYAVACAVTTRNGYGTMAMRREIEDVQAQNALLRYQIHVTESSQRVQRAAEDMELRPADPVTEVDYVALPYPDAGAERALAAADPTRESGGLAEVLAGLAMEVEHGARSRAEASTVEGHRP